MVGTSAAEKALSARVQLSLSVQGGTGTGVTQKKGCYVLLLVAQEVGLAPRDGEDLLLLAP